MSIIKTLGALFVSNQPPDEAPTRRRFLGTAPSPRPKRVENKTYDPPSHAAPASRPLSTDELTAVISGTGTRPGYPGANYEGNPAMSPWRFTGAYPDPGYAESMSRRSPVIASGLWRRRAYAMAKEVRVGDVKGATSEDKARSQMARDMLASWFPHFWGRCWYSRDKFGFGLFEKVWEVDPDTLAWRLEDMVWIHPSTIYGWVVDASGFYVGILQRSERSGFVHSPMFIPSEKLGYFGGRAFMGRNYSCPGALRPLYYWSELLRELMANYAASVKILGEGWIDVTTENDRGSEEWAALENLVNSWDAAENRGVVHGSLTSIEPRHGGGALPDIEKPTRIITQKMVAGLDAELQSQGQNAYGSRAVGETQFKSTHITLLGECSEILLDCQQVLLADIYARNGWDTKRLPPMFVPGMIDYENISRARLLLETARDGVDMPFEWRDEMRRAALEMLGVPLTDEPTPAPAPPPTDSLT